MSCTSVDYPTKKIYLHVLILHVLKKEHPVWPLNQK